MRTFYLYAKSSGKYEIIPEGFSAFAFFLGPFWAVANGLIVELFGIVGIFSIPLVALVGIFGESVPAILIGILIQFFGYTYFASIAYKLRAKDLKRYGYQQIAAIESTSPRAALRDWSQTDEAAQFLEEGPPKGPATRP